MVYMPCRIRDRQHDACQQSTIQVIPCAIGGGAVALLPRWSRPNRLIGLSMLHNTETYSPGGLMLAAVTFSSMRFQPVLPEECQVNPGRYGAELAFCLC